ncbi:MAG: competence ComEA-like helix-hairpin-helix protein [Verrucomicrobiales bacterium]|jgi:competence ComEA-like helix-hairpin-helix protein
MKPINLIKSAVTLLLPFLLVSPPVSAADDKPTAQEREILAAEQLLDELSSSDKGKLTRFVNHGAAKELIALPGIGKLTAVSIIEARPLESSAHLVAIKNIGLKTMEKIVKFVDGGGLASSSSSSTTPDKPVAAADPSAEKSPPTKGGKIDVNAASLAELKSLSGIGDVTAKLIIEGRPYKAIEDLMKIKGIGKGAFDKIKDSIVAD